MKETDPFFENSLDLMSIASQNGYFIQINRSWTRVLGYTMDTLMASTYFDFVHPDDKHITSKEWNKTLGVPSPSSPFSNRYRTSSGNYRHFSWNTFSQGDLVYVIARDVEDMSNMGSLLKQCQLQLKWITDALPAFVFQLDKEETVAFYNSTCNALFFQSTATPTYGIHFAQAFKASSVVEFITQSLQTFKKSHSKYCSEIRLQVSKNESKIFSCIATKVNGSGLEEEDQGTIFSGWEITDVYEQHQQHLQAEAETAQEVSKLKSEFLSIISHELRTPLMGIIGIAELLYGSFTMTAEQRKLADSSMKSSDLLLSIINDILDYSKIEANQLILEAEAFNPEKCLEESLLLHSSEAKQKNLELMSYFARHLPAVILGDRGRLSQMAGMLLSNAIKFTSEGSVILTCQPESCPVPLIVKGISKDILKKYPEAEFLAPIRIKVCIEDTGIGIGEEAKRRLFQPFCQADSSFTRKFGGAGLGLAICRSLARMMEGDVEYESHGNKGSKFWFYVTTYPLNCHGSNTSSSLTLTPSSSSLANLTEQITSTSSSSSKTLFSKSSDDSDKRRELESHSLRDVKVAIVDNSPQTTKILCSYMRDWSIEYSIFNYESVAKNHALLRPHWFLLVHHYLNPAPIPLDLLVQTGKPVILFTNLDPEKYPYSMKAEFTLGLDFSRKELLNVLLRVHHRHGSERIASPQPAQKSTTLSVIEKVKDKVQQLGRRIQVLIVDDNQVNQEFMSGVLRKMDIDFDKAFNGLEAVELYSNGFHQSSQPFGFIWHHYDLIFMDCQMPEMDGYEATVRIRELERGKDMRTPVIALTANVMKQHQALCISSGMDDFMTKPFKIATFGAMLDRWLQRLPPPLREIGT